MKNSILLIDGHSILNRAFYGVPPLTNSKGLHTNAVYGFLNMMLKAVDDICPDHIAVAFDLPAPTFRHKMYSEYKGTRKKMPDELVEQVPLIQSALDAMNISILKKEGLEADDLIGSTAVAAAKSNMTVTILSGDRDLLQLVNDKVTLMLPKSSKGKTTIEYFTPQRVEDVYSVSPDQIVDLKAMMGDSSDNIPGLPGVGEKTATNLIIKYGSLEEAHAHLEEIRPKKAMEAFRDHYDMGILSKELAAIKTDAAIDISLEAMYIEDFYTKEAYSIFKELEFKNLLVRFDNSNMPKTGDIDINVTEDITDAEALVSKAIKAQNAGFYLDIRNEELCGLALSFDNATSYIVSGGFISDDYLKSSLLQIIKKCRASTMDFKEQNVILKSEFTPDMFDCSIAAYLLDPLRSEYTYEHIAAEYANAELPSIEEMVGSKITAKTVITNEYYIKAAAYRAYAANKARDGLGKALEATGSDRLFYEVEMPFAYTLSEMENAGIRMNSQELKEYSDMLKLQIEELEKSIYAMAGEEFNIQSPKQLGVILFEKLQLPGGKKTKTGYSTAVDVLEKLADTAPIVNDILKFRQLAKLKSTYADSLGNYIKADGRIHSHFQQTVTATGRISSADPNMQNIPIRMEAGRRIRRVFIPDEGCIFIDADYSQIELRVLAHMSGDEKLIEAYRSDSDIHKITASQVFSVPLDEVTPIQRRNAKAVNFGIVYGISSFGLSQDLSISRKEAQVYIEKYFETYPGIKKYLDETVENARKNGYTTTMFGRRRPIPELKASNHMQRMFGERVAMNSPIQGTAADIIKIAMINVAKRIKNEGLKARLILQVHDELLIEAAKCEVAAVERLLREEMENAAKLSVSLVVDMNSGYNWDEAH